ncbi:MAG TPA: hypothetical protein VN736_23115 [Candidatus Limnocylindrales bacterium]|nr:hypothetical protein [Candidatus Limnocylindrales bacterium]
MRTLVLLTLGIVCANAQDTPANRITLSGAWGHDIGRFASFERQSAAGFGVSYGRRIRRFLEPEIGLFVALDPSGEQCSRFGCVDTRDRFYWLPFGLRFVASTNRLEFSGGGGGLFEQYTGGTPLPGGGPFDRHGWGGYFVASAGVALDRGKHLWLSGTPRWFLANPKYARDRWLQVSGEVSWRW